MGNSDWGNYKLFIQVLCFLAKFDLWRLITHDFWTLQAKICLIAGVALLLVRAMRVQASAATRYMVLAGAMIAAFSLPILALLPSWTLATINRTLPAQEFRIPIGPTIKVITVFDKNGSHTITQAFFQPMEEVMKHHPNTSTTVSPNRLPQFTTYTGSGYITPLGVVELLAQIIGMGLITRLVAMMIGLKLLANRSQSAATSIREYLPPKMERVQIRLGGDAPMTWGWLRPILLLPGDAAQWPAERLRAVILHECAHIARRDWLTQTLAQFLCAFFCFNPLLWILAKQMRKEAEIACDDAVLLAGISAPDYASHLLDVARLLKNAKRKAAGAVAMASHSEVGDRLASILDKNRLRTLTDAATRLDNLCVVAIVMLILGTSSIRYLPNAKSPSPVRNPNANGDISPRRSVS
ncbi:hypothetical protein CCAX7_006730 [Capsulimonas corticalis]|uniref:Uncharacterized protein n=1 Tax=Capsulimonas corticalis TaxID=2219043 RepID=A0A402D1F6_9BACT|nr:M56 family metallopeptidase [Capsulimonas corticalis]BDI28622.1 hypothetical protein CCAX7_006730 [Capsulimonas corticalis]